MKMLRITLEGKTYEVGVEVLEDTATPVSQPVPTQASPQQSVPIVAEVGVAARVVSPAEGCSVVTSPMAGLVFKCLVKPGEVVTVNQVVIVLDAMKMETPVVSPYAGTVQTVLVREGDAVDEGHAMLQIKGKSA